MELREEYYRDLTSSHKRGLGAAALRLGLRAISVFYGVGVRGRNWLYDRGWLSFNQAAVPVVSVGNLTLGGTGKTPCVEYVARFYRRHEMRVAILSRGYGAQVGPNDEALVLEENLPDVPHLQGTDRTILAQTAVEELESQVLVLDDGFQHRRLGRDLDIVLLDATNPWGYGYLFPRGFLREPPRSLERADIVVLTRCDQVSAGERAQLRQQVVRFAKEAPCVESIHRPLELVNSEGATRPITSLEGIAIQGFCGLGNPEAFRRTLQNLGAEMLDFRTFPDHHPYTRTDVNDLRAWAATRTKDCLIVTTQKDLVKLRLAQLGGHELWALRIGLHLEAGQEALDHKLLEAVRGQHPA